MKIKNTNTRAYANINIRATVDVMFCNSPPRNQHPTTGIIQNDHLFSNTDFVAINRPRIDNTEIRQNGSVAFCDSAKKTNHKSNLASLLS